MSEFLDAVCFDEFIDVAMNVLEAPFTTPTWEEFRAAALAPIILLYPHREVSAEKIVPAIPATTIDRIQWISNGVAEHTFHEYLDTRGSSLLSVLLNEIQYANRDARNLAQRLMAFVIERPALLHQLVFRIRQAPVLLADMLMAPSTCALACSLIASWEYNAGGWNRDFQARADHTTELLAFEDAVAVLGSHLDAGTVPANELAALYQHIYQLASGPRHSSRHYAALSLLRQELTASVASDQFTVVAALIGSARVSKNKMTAFCAALDLVSESGGADRIEPPEIVSLYLDLLLQQGERVGPRQLEMNSAQCFVSLALRCEETLLPDS